MKTKFGNAKINKDGYYQITSVKEGNKGKLLHRLIATDYFGEWINDSEEHFDIHHIDGNKLNNCVLNLEPLPHKYHLSLHKSGENHPFFGKHHSEETKKKMSDAKKGENNHFYGKQHSEETQLKMSKTQNISGYFRVSKLKNKTYKQGFTWKYQYYENSKKKYIYSVDLEKLEAKVKAKGLKWKKL